MFTFPLAFSRHYGILVGGFYGKKGIFVEKLSRNDHIDLYRHLAFSAVGGFFGCHAVLVHGGIMGNAQTVNLLELLLDALRGDAYATALHLGALALYVLGTMLTVLLPHWWGWDMHRVSPLVTAAAL